MYEAFFPYIKIPTLYTLAANHTTPPKVAYKITKLSNTCHQSTPKGIRISITIGDVNGINENTVATVPCGLFITVKKPTYTANINTIITGIINCWVSVSLSTAAPIDTYKELYNKYPPIKYRKNEIINDNKGSFKN